MSNKRLATTRRDITRNTLLMIATRTTHSSGRVACLCFITAIKGKRYHGELSGGHGHIIGWHACTKSNLRLGLLRLLLAELRDSFSDVRVSNG